MPGSSTRSLTIHIRLAPGDLNAQPSPPDAHPEDDGLLNDGANAVDHLAGPHHPPDRRELEHSTTDHISQMPDWVHIDSLRRVSGF